MRDTTAWRSYSQRVRDLFTKMDGEPLVAFTTVPFSSLLAIAVAQISLVLGVGGVFLVLTMHGQGNSDARILGFAMTLLGAILAATVPVLYNRTFLVCPGGLIRRDWKGTEICRWEDLSHIRQDEPGRFCLVRKDGRSWQVDSADFTRGDEWEGILRASAEQHAIEWQSKK